MIKKNLDIHGTTVLAVRRKDKLSMGSDGQVTFGNSVVMKHHAKKVRKIFNGQIIVGFAGSTADAFTLLELFEEKIQKHLGNLTRSSVELAKDWRTDKILRRLEAFLLVADIKKTFVISGTGDVLEPDDDVMAIGSGGAYAQSAAKALIENTKLGPEEIVKKSLLIAADTCIYTNSCLTIETL